MTEAKTIIVTGSFDDFRSEHVRLLEKASELGDVRVLLWPDEAVCAFEGHPPIFPQEERLYLLSADRYVSAVSLATGQPDRDTLPEAAGIIADIWVVDERSDKRRKQTYCRQHGVEYRILKKDDLKGFPVLSDAPRSERSARKRVIVTGCFDWFHSGHVRFFEEVSELGDLYVVVGHDANIRLLKGEGHPMFSQDERRYMVQSVRFVKQALISSGHGWMDAEPEVAVVKPDIYAVNEDGDVPEKRAFCKEHGIEYVVLKRIPKAGLPQRQSTTLRGF
ncbi:MAG: adenylyltransferase/cytidyltransferase family protein [Terriglobia bacterium]|jgi:cytidyltransferase-like protein